MVGIVVVSHSQKLAEGVVELASLMAPETPMKAAGGMDDGGFGNPNMGVRGGKRIGSTMRGRVQFITAANR